MSLQACPKLAYVCVSDPRLVSPSATGAAAATATVADAVTAAAAAATSQ
jgi:hypothetical protein